MNVYDIVMRADAGLSVTKGYILCASEKQKEGDFSKAQRYIALHLSLAIAL